MPLSDAEAALIFQLKAVGVSAPISELRFHPTRKWRFDLAWPDLLVAVEVEGGSWSAGRHTRGVGFEGDCEKYDEAQLAGWLVLRVTPHMIDDGRALAFVERAFVERYRASR